MLHYQTIEEICTAAEAHNVSISSLVLREQALTMEESEKNIYSRMKNELDVMRNAVSNGLTPGLRSISGMSGGDAAKLWSYSDNGGILGGFANRAIARAVAVAEYNASMGKIVAAPTAGSCGILPGTVVSALEEERCTEEAAVMSLFTAGAVGMVISNRASLSGAEGGCQAECGSASAMAAASLVELFGGTPAQLSDAIAIAIKNQLGLVCDPVAGLVEIPCIKRNVSGVMIAFSAAEMALAGVHSKIPADECILAMRQIGETMSCDLKETAKGGLAATPTGMKLKDMLFGNG